MFRNEARLCEVRDHSISVETALRVIAFAEKTHSRILNSNAKPTVTIIEYLLLLYPCKVEFSSFILQRYRSTSSSDFILHDQVSNLVPQLFIIAVKLQANIEGATPLWLNLERVAEI
jgi:hypothetical protein